jgi:hypothetical protein
VQRVAQTATASRRSGGAEVTTGTIKTLDFSRAGFQTHPMRKGGDSLAVTLKDLQRIPGIGPSLSQDLVDLGIKRASDLRGRDPERLYHRLCSLRGERQDRCVLYVFRCAIYFVSRKHHDPERLKWWRWKDS